jgi:hypothetical protein
MTDENKQPTCPMPRDKVVDRYFMEHRAKLLDVAAFLDRIDRSEAPADADDDFRVEAMQRAIQLLGDEKGDRAKRVLELFSDPTTEPIDKAPMKGADGAYNKSDLVK